MEAPEYPANDLEGKGAEKTGGRWNAQGTPMLYTSTTMALACLETIVHLEGGKSLPLNRYLVRLDVPDDVWAAATTLDPAAHVGWDALPAGKTSIDWGTNWAASMASALAFVPSVIIPEEFNALVNPRHPDAAKLRATKLRKMAYDPRALGQTI